MKTINLLKKLSYTLLFLLISPCLFANKPLHFNKDGKFKILQLTDIHWVELPNYAKTNDSTLALIDYLITQEQPDLIVITGDIVVSKNALQGWKNFLTPIHKPGLCNRVIKNIWCCFNF